MPIYDMECQTCGTVFEAIMPIDREETDCAKCGRKAVRIISVSGQNCANEDASWIRSVLEVVDHSSDAPHTREFIKNPTRANYKAWMKGEGLRPVEDGERLTRPKRDDSRIREYMLQKAYERRGITIG